METKIVTKLTFESNNDRREITVGIHFEDNDAFIGDGVSVIEFNDFEWPRIRDEMDRICRMNEDEVVEPAKETVDVTCRTGSPHCHHVLVGIGSYICQTACKYFVSYDEENQIVKCSHPDAIKAGGEK